MAHLGDFDTAATIYGKFTTYRPSTGAAFTLGGTPALSVYKDNSVTQSTSGVTLTADFDAVTGLNHFTIDTSLDGTFYAAGSFFDVVITTGTVDGVSVVGSVVASFTIRKTSTLKPTTAGRTLDVSAGGEAGVDWANVGSPTTVVGLTGTTIATTQKVDVETIKTNPVVNAGTITFPTGATLASTTNITAGTVTTATNVTTVNGLAAGVITAAAIADGAIDRATFAADTGLQSVRSATAQAGAATTVTLDAAASATTDVYKGQRVYLTGGTGAGQDRIITAYNGTTKVATVTPAWATNPDATSTFAIVPNAQADAEAIAGAAVSTTAAQIGVNVVNAAGTAWGSGAITAASVAASALNGKGDWNVGKTGYSLTAGTGLGNQTANITGNLSGSVGSVTGSVGSVTGAVGSVTGAVGSVTATVNAAVVSMGADVLTAAATAADFGTELRDTLIQRTTLRGTVGAASTTTSIVTSAMSPATSVADQVKGRIVIFDHNTTTAALRGQATDITASSASATPTLTVTALTTAPVSGDTFTIV